MTQNNRLTQYKLMVVFYNFAMQNKLQMLSLEDIPILSHILEKIDSMLQLNNNVMCQIKASKVKQIQEESDEDDLSSMLDDIEYDVMKRKLILILLQGLLINILQYEYYFVVCLSLKILKITKSI